MTLMSILNRHTTRTATAATASSPSSPKSRLSRLSSHLLAGSSPSSPSTRPSPPFLAYSTTASSRRTMASTTTPRSGLSLDQLPKSNTFTSHLPPDPAFETPEASHEAARETLGPRIVKGAMFTYVRPEPSEDAELLAVSPRALKDIGLKEGEEETEAFREMVAGNKIFWSKEGGGVYPWSQCYGGFQFGTWAGQLGDGRAISLFESTNPTTNKRYEIQLKGAGLTPYSRFADGRAVLRSSIREFIASEALNALGIPSTRALALTHLPRLKVRRERIEPGAIVTRFAESWVRLGTFDLLRARGERDLTRQLADYVAVNVLGGWGAFPGRVAPEDGEEDGADKHVPSSRYVTDIQRGVGEGEIQGEGKYAENRYARLYRQVVRLNAATVARWQGYGFMNGVLNTDNTSVLGLSLDFGPFAFMDNFDSAYTPNHDDGALRYSYRNQPHIIWWNLVRFGEAMAELIGAGAKVDEEGFVRVGVKEEEERELVERAESIIMRTGDEYTSVFLHEYKHLMSRRFGLRTQRDADLKTLVTPILDTLETLELDFNHFFRRLSGIRLKDIETQEQRTKVAGVFFHAEGPGGAGVTERGAREDIGNWLEAWRARVLEDWGDGAEQDEERIKAMKAVNPKFVPRSWILDEVIDRVQNKGDRDVLKLVMRMTLDPFAEEWGVDREEEERLCGDPPRFERKIMCSCSS